jgi:membrane glycosyltransferase
MFGFLLLIFIALTAIFNLLGLIVQGPMGLTPTIVSLFTTLFVWIGLNQNN